MTTYAYSQKKVNGITVQNKSIHRGLPDAGLLLALALVAFELFSFDVARFALADLLGDVSFAGLRWATVLAVAFCSIDFAGLIRFFMLENGDGDRAEAWYWMGAWLLGAMMHALLAWWAVSLMLVDYEAGGGFVNLSGLIHILPIFIALLAWFMRILFVGAFALLGGHLFVPKAVRQETLPAIPAAPLVQEPIWIGS